MYENTKNGGKSALNILICDRIFFLVVCYLFWMVFKYGSMCLLMVDLSECQESDMIE